MISLSYEEMLGELLALIGKPIQAEVKVRVANEMRPLVFLQGELRRGVDADLSTQEGEPTSFTAGETMMFSVGEPRGTASVFCLVREGFKLGRKTEDGTLAFQTGKVAVSVWPLEP